MTIARKREARPTTSLVAKQILLVYLALGGAVFVVFFREYLPDKYSYDTAKIRRLALGLQQTENDPSYQNTGDFYGVLGLGHSPVLAGLLGFGVFAALLLTLLRRTNIVRLNWWSVLLLLGVVPIGSVYLGTYTKEVLVAAIAGLVLVGRRSIRWDFALVGGMLLYASFFRTYWFLVAINFVVLRFWTLRRLTLLRIGFVMGLALLVLALAFPIVLGESLNAFREQVNADRVDSVDAVTTISAPIPLDGVVGGWINALALLGYLMLPLDLALRGGVFYLVAASFVGYAWVCFWRGAYLVSGRGHSSGDNDESVDVVHVRIVLLLASFVTIQAIFEPDYGSYLRHLAPLLPLFVFLTLRTSRNSLRVKRVALRNKGTVSV